MSVRLARVYDDPATTQGKRILVDRIWPRGLSKDKADLDEWLKDVAPSTELRKWYAHDPDKTARFAERYRAELEQEPAASAALQHLRDLADGHVVTLLTASKDLEVSQARVLADLLTRSSA